MLNFKNNCRKKLISYYKSECLDCNLIYKLNWERPYFGTSINIEPAKKEICPFCQAVNIKVITINKSEYKLINQHWDMLSPDKDNNNQNNYFACNSFN
ncbi:MAG: hypothetical protein KAH84_04795 [Thiomargarita sp.]|nr:hypothetical protein [Thiomargarita sp.]